jgi:hypothetical protein
MDLFRLRAAVAAGMIAAVALTCGQLAAAEPDAAPPVFGACNPASPPELPEHWRAVGLLSQFEVSQLEVGEFIYDGKLSAMRAAIYGLEGGAVDVLITPTETYQITGPYDAPTGCVSMGRLFEPPSNRWLSERSVCVGEMPIAKIPAQWWKSPAAEGRANWLWLNKATRLPMRSVFTAPTDDPPVFGNYAMIHFSTFTPLPETNLAKLQNFCVEKVRQAQTIAPGEAANNAAGEAERQERITMLVPGLSLQACSRMSQARWPDQFVMSVALTPTAMDQNPYPALIYYDWRDTKTQLAKMFGGTPPQMKGMVLLKNGIGYRIQQRQGVPVCEPVFPGTVRPDWTTNAWCQCRGVIENNPALSPDATTQILSCPIRHQGKRVMWSWFASDGRPALFMEAAAQGGGVMFADYYDWLPGQAVPKAELELPSYCTAPEHLTGLSGFRTFADPSCADCHTSR